MSGPMLEPTLGDSIKITYPEAGYGILFPIARPEGPEIKKDFSKQL
jgi:hypothetical protein